MTGGAYPYASQARPMCGIIFSFARCAQFQVSRTFKPCIAAMAA